MAAAKPNTKHDRAIKDDDDDDASATKRAKTVDGPGDEKQFTFTAVEVDPLDYFDHHIRSAIPTVNWNEASMLLDHVRLLCTAHQLHGQERQVLRQFYRFFLLSSFVFASDSERDVPHLSPTPLMDSIWHHCILSTRFYKSLCDKLCNGRFLHHRIPPDTPEETAARNERLAVMRFAYHRVYGVDPLETNAPEPVPCSYQIFVKYLTGVMYLINANPSDTVYFFKLRIWAETQIPPCQQLLVFDGRHFEDHCQLQDYPTLQNESSMYLVLNLRGC